MHTQNGKTTLNTGAFCTIIVAFVCSFRKETMMVQKMLAGLVVASLLAVLVSA